MRTDKSPEEFFDRMKKKPALQKILNGLESYTVQELENIKGQPLWIRNVLATKRKRIDQGVKYTKENYAAIALDELVKIEIRPENDPTYKFQVRRWIGSDWFMSCGRTGSMKIEIKPNDYLIVNSKTFEASISSSKGKLNIEDWNFLMQNTETVGMMTRQEFTEFVSKKLVPFADHETALSGNVKQSDDRGLFKIIRHD